MIQIDYSSFKFKLKQVKDKDFIYDEIRKKWLVLTPEEWVRQNFIKYLTQILQYPKSLIAIEKQFKINDTVKRFDIVVYKDSEIYILIECKKTEMFINENTIQQLLSYQTVLQAKIIIMTNGNTIFGYEMQENNVVSLEQIPSWN